MVEQNTPSELLPDLMALALFVAGISVMLFLQFNKNAALKRRVLRWSLVLMIPFVPGFFWAAHAPVPFILLSIPGAAFIAFVNLRNIRFCDACGRTLVSYNLIFRQKFCSSCGESLN